MSTAHEAATIEDENDVAATRAADRSIAVKPSVAAAEAPFVSVFGVRIAKLHEFEAVCRFEQWINEYRGRSKAVYFVNAHTLNLAAREPAYRDLLNRGQCVFGDGTGVRWAAHARGVRMKANLNGTDLIPRLFRDTAGQGYRYFLLGATAETIARAAVSASDRFPGWTLVGHHHGFIDMHHAPDVIKQINDARPHVLLVGMGNPLQEQWIDRHLDQLHVPLCFGTGGLFDHWAGNLRRAPRWVRRLGYEWLQLLMQQPHKWRRYLLGNPAFLWRMVRNRRQDMSLMAGADRARR
jgi:N-acetylglucosaminyldiphosphoundecaprenol N-acetyl-beta-D-mannosaminyltransferase